jgi:enediyne biosynthesis protein E4
MDTSPVPQSGQDDTSPVSTRGQRSLIHLGLVLGVCVVALGLYFGISYMLRPKVVIAPPPKSTPVDVRNTHPVPKGAFMDVTEKAGLAFTHYNGTSGKKLLPETMGGGVCVLDYDGDGHQDVLFVSSCPWPGHKGPDKPGASCLTLYRNKGDGTFEDVTAAAGLTVTMYGMGACAGDIDNDGYPDLFITGVGGCKLFRNVAGKDGKRKFVEAKDAGIVCRGQWPGHLSAKEFLEWKEPIEFATSATFLDYDGDGKLDLFVCSYVTWAPAIDLAINSNLTGVGRAFLPPQQFEGSQCQLYRNLGNCKFQDVTEPAGIKVVDPVINAPARPVAKSLGVAVCDVDGDGWPDLIVANDTVRNFFFHNVPAPGGGRKFEEKGLFVNVAYAEGRARGAMGIDWGEYLPGKRGAVIANFANEPLTFLTMPDPKKIRFTDSALPVGLAGPSRFWLKFGTFFFDYDLDGRLDLLVCNGHLEPDIAKVQEGQLYAQPPQLFWNTGDEAHVFEPVTSKDAGEDLFKPLVGRGSAYLDFNGDGTLDVILVENNGSARLLQNDTKLGNKYIRLTLVGDGKTANTSAIGAQVTVEAGGKTYSRDVASARGYLSQSELPVTVGLGTTEKVDKITVRWPGKDAGTQVWTDLKANARYTLRQGKAEAETTDLKK